jgi:GNAT superfamily N-acetyltransferase
VAVVVSVPYRARVPIQTRSFAAEDVDAVAALAADSYLHARAAEPLLGGRLGDPGQLRARIADLTGTVAVREGELAAAWLAAPSGGAQAAPAWGVVGELDAIRAAYAVQAAGWVPAGARTHTAMVNVADVALHDALVDLGFGHEQAYAVRTLEDPTPAPDGVDVRPGTPADLDAVLSLAPVIGRHQVQSPVFARVGPSFFGQLEESHREELANPEAHYLLASVDGEVLGAAIWYLGEEDWLVPPQSSELAWAVVAESARGRGVGLALTAAAMAAATDAGATSMVTDWRTTNLLSSRFWPGRGFRPIAHRMARTIDPEPAD